MQMNNAEHSRLHVHYSPSNRYSIGVVTQHFRNSDLNTAGLQLNWLAYRYNTRTSQSNVYLKARLGGAYKAALNDTEPYSAISIAGDSETRRWFVGGNFEYRNAGDFSRPSLPADQALADWRYQARLGVAPYLADYGDLHTWLMIQTQQHQLQSNPRFACIVRLFKGDSLIEFGIDNDGRGLFNWIVRY